MQTIENDENTEGPLRPILKEMFANVEMKLPLRFSLKKNIQHGKVIQQIAG
jgi:hypothetical protein